MVDSLLRLQYDAGDAATATAAARAVLGSAEVTSSSGSMRWRQTSLVDDGITISRLQIQGEGVHLTIEKASELLIVLVRTGSVLLRNGADEVTLSSGALGLIPIGARGRMDVARAGLDLISFPPAPIARLLGVAKHAVQLNAPRTTPRTTELAAYFSTVARLLTTEVFAVPAVYGRDLVRVQTIDLLTAIAVEAFELTNRSEDNTDRDIVVLRRAIAELRAHLTEPISIPEIAAAAGVSVRALQLIFQRQLGVSPLLHLRNLRLEGARTTLLDEADRGITVADVARRFGYANSGRFSTHYRDAYGESPAAALREVRRRPEQSTSEEAQAVDSHPEDRSAPEPLARPVS